MSKNKLSTREVIIEKALELFNEQGIEYVGVRELAAALGMKGGNITYYFPTKDDIVIEIARMLSEANCEVIIKQDGINVSHFMEMLEVTYQNHYRFRCLFMSFANLLIQIPPLREQYKKRSVLRKETIVNQLQELIKGGYLKQLTNADVDVLYTNILLMSRFWIANASIEEELGAINKTRQKYLGVIAGLLSLAATAKGNKELQVYLK